MLKCESLPSREMPAFLTVAGGSLSVLADDGALLYVYRDVIEQTAASVPFQVAVSPDGKTAALGAGAGGSPRVVGVDLDTGGVVFSVFVGDPDSRSGVGVGAFSVMSIFQAEPSPTLPGDTTKVSYYVSRLPDAVQEFLRDHDQHLYVYGGDVITDDPLFSAFRGVQTASGGDGGRTFDQVPALYYGRTQAAYVRPYESERIVVHELGHAVEQGLTTLQHAAWDAIFVSSSFGTEYERLNSTEAFAESFRRWIIHTEQPNGRIDAFFNSAFVG